MAVAPTVVRLDGVSAGYHGIPVLHRIDLEVREGEIVALLGPNGAGKTTTLLTISGFVAPMEGTVEVLGEPVSTRQVHKLARRGVAHVPEGRALFASLTVRENIELAARGRPDASDAALRHFPRVAPLADRRAGLLSGGEQQMLALARALALQPRLLLIDEMSQGLAPVIVEQLFDTLRSIVDGTRMSVLFVEQHVHAALSIADRAYVLQRGTVALDDDSDTLAGRPDLLERTYLG